MGFKRPEVRIFSLGPKRAGIVRFQLFFFIKSSVKSRPELGRIGLLLTALLTGFLQIIRDFPQVFDLDVLIITQHFVGGMTDKFELVFVGCLDIFKQRCKCVAA